MSETETLKGTVKFIPIPEGKTIEDLCEFILCIEKEITFAKEHECDITEVFRDEFYKEAVVASNGVYKVIKSVEVDPDDDVYDASLNEDGTIDYFLRYYNGGCSFEEALLEAIERMEK